MSDMDTDPSRLESQKARTKIREGSRHLQSHAALWEAFRIAADSIWNHRLRSALTLLGIVIGVASVVAVGGAIEGLGSFVSDRLVATFGSNTFIVARIARMNISSEEHEELARRNKRIRPDDLEAVEGRCEDCEAVSPMLGGSDDAKRESRVFYDATIQGVDSDLPKIQALEIEEGRFLSNFDVFHTRPYVVIGSDIREELFGPTEAVGREIKVGGDSFTVIGVEKKNGSFFGQSMDNRIYIPYTAFLKKYGARRSIQFRVKAPSAALLEPTQDEVRQIIRSRHKLGPKHEDDFDILSSTAMQDTVARFTGAVAVVVTPITLISLLVGGIVVMNIMLVTVTERTNEVGLRKAVGARQRDILFQFLVESALLASVGGVIGILVAYGAGLVIAKTTPVPIDITAAYVALAVLTSGGVGMISGIYPAYKASKLDPHVALSRE